MPSTESIEMVAGLGPEASTLHKVPSRTGEHDTKTIQPGDAASESQAPDNRAQFLPQQDRGTAAWKLLLSSFIFEAVLWGFPLSFGVFQNYYRQLPQFKGQNFVSVIGTVASGLTYMGAPFIIPLSRRFAKWRRHMICLGWMLCLLGLVAGSFATTIPTLVLTQGVMYGLGFTIAEYPMISMVNEFWVERRGLAYGLLCASSGLSGTVFPFIIERLLAHFGYQTTLRAVAVAVFVLTGPLMFTLKSRYPADAISRGVNSPTGRTSWSFVKTRLFWIYSASNLAMGLGYFFPSLYLPSYAVANGLSATQGALLLAIMSIAQVVGQITCGYLSDHKMPLDILMICSTLVAGVAAYTIWGLAHSLGILIVFAIIYGSFGAGYTALWGRIGTRVSDESSGAFAAYGMLNFGKGIGNVLAGPIGGALLSRRSVTGGQYGAGQYEAVVLFTGSAMVLSSFIVVLTTLTRSKRR